MTYALSHITTNDERLSLLVSYVGEIRLRQRDDLFRFVVCEIVGQMLSSKVKHTLVNRLIELCNNSITPGAILSLGEVKLKGIGISSAKCSYIIGFAERVQSGELDLDSLRNMGDEEAVKVLTQLKGIGSWTAKMVLLFALGRENVLPYEDVAFQQGYKWLYNIGAADKDEIIVRAKNWEPYCSIASLYIYECVNQGLIKLSPDILLQGKY